MSPAPLRTLRAPAPSAADPSPSLGFALPPVTGRSAAPASDPPAPLTHAALIAQLRTRGLRLTPSRSAMLAALLDCSAPVTLAQLQHAVRPQRVALATLFRSMLRMEQVDLVTRTIDLHGTTNWELNVGRRHAFHLMHRATGAITPLDPLIAQPLHDLLARIADHLHDRGYRHLRLNVAFRGALRDDGQPATSVAPQRHVA